MLRPQTNAGRPSSLTAARARKSAAAAALSGKSFSGQVGTPGESVGDQTREVLRAIDSLLAAAGTDKTRLLSATIWLADIADFSEMNRVWDAWVPKGQAPVRATGESRLAAPGYKVEIIAIAAL